MDHIKLQIYLVSFSEYDIDAVLDLFFLCVPVCVCVSLCVNLGVSGHIIFIITKV